LTIDAEQEGQIMTLIRLRVAHKFVPAMGSEVYFF